MPQPLGDCVEFLVARLPIGFIDVPGKTNAVELFNSLLRQLALIVQHSLLGRPFANQYTLVGGVGVGERAVLLDILFQQLKVEIPAVGKGVIQFSKYLSDVTNVVIKLKFDLIIVDISTACYLHESCILLRRITRLEVVYNIEDNRLFL